MAGIVGRDDELRAIEAFLADAPVAPSALVLVGEPGIGKSTLWRRGVELAAERGFRALVARPAEAEQGHAHAALGDLLEDALDDVVSELPPPRRHALRVALLLEDPEDVPPPPFAVGVATRSAVEALARREPLVIAIDDAQWLDASSATALAFAVRRLTAPVRLLLSRRAGPGGGIEDAIPDDRIEHLGVGALSLGAIHQLLHDRVGASFSRIALRRLHDTSGGNPFYALELARALGCGRVASDLTQPLPVPERLEELVQAGLQGFTGRTREALVLASAHARLTPAQLAAAACRSPRSSRKGRGSSASSTRATRRKRHSGAVTRRPPSAASRPPRRRQQRRTRPSRRRSGGAASTSRRCWSWSASTMPSPLSIAGRRAPGASAASGSSRTRRGAAGSSRPRGVTSGPPRTCSSTRPRDIAPSASRSERLGRSSRSASSAGERGRSEPPARRSRKPLRPSTRSARTAGPTGPAASSAASAAVRAATS